MIRRHLGDKLYLIPQDQHAHLSGQLLAHYGNAHFQKPQPTDQTLRAATIHDAGWPIHDRHPTLNHEHFPLDVFETPSELAVRVWRESADRAASESAYTQLLVSLHVLGLSGYAASRPRTRRELFELNKFQQYEIERQETLRKQLGLATNIPLQLGISQGSDIPAEQHLAYNLALVQLADRISLSLCCTELLFPQIPGIARHPGGETLTFNLRRINPQCLEIAPWPFDQPLLSLSVPYRIVPSRQYDNEAQLQKMYAAAEDQTLQFTVRAAL